jgi:hypothetical protein
LPAGQAIHAEADDMPEKREYVPAAHGRHAPALFLPASATYVPAEQFVQEANADAPT